MSCNDDHRIAALEEAIRQDAVDEVRRLLGAGVSPNARIKNGAPVLALAVSVHCAAVISVLLEAGADPNAPDTGGYPPLTSARTPEVAGLLIDAGADMDARAPSGLRLIELFLLAGSTRMVKLMLERGAKIPDEMRDPKYWADLGERVVPAKRLVDAHLMADRIEGAMGDADWRCAAKPGGGMAL